MHRWKTEFAELGDVRIAYREAGVGPALLLLHGNSGNKSMFAEHQAVHFPAFRTLAVDSRGHGESGWGGGEFSIAQYAGDMIAFCRAKGIRRAYVIGYSDGGNIALHLACRAPETFPKIVAVSPNYRVDGTTDDMLRMIRAVGALLSALAGLGPRLRNASKRWNLMLRDIGLTADDLRGVRTNVRILYAEHDMIKEDHIREIARLIPNAGLRKIARSSHLSIISKPEAIADMREFLAGG
jgi:pimeloyl-ACP methyl ester carboxylesterase